MALKERSANCFLNAQTVICDALELLDTGHQFSCDEWTRGSHHSVSPSDAQIVSGITGGGGLTRVLKAGAVFEQAGVNLSKVSGILPEGMSKKLLHREEPLPFSATGISLVVHPCSPHVPTVHANFRYLEVDEKRWFGGGADLTPYYLDRDDASHFHRVLKEGCDRHDPSYYPRFKAWCDEYFYLPHRRETRGVGGIFFDYLGRDGESLESIFTFVQDLCSAFVHAYMPIVEKNVRRPWSEAQRSFQLYRRGRYAEFNLLYDRGTQFGLQTGGRVESILMSLPPLARWEYDAEFSEGSPEHELISILREPQKWV